VGLKRTPIKRKPARKRKKPPTRRVRQKRMTVKAKKMWADRIKQDQQCFFAGKMVGGKRHVCKGYLQAMHCFGKKAYPASRFELWNGICGCAAAHTYYTYHPVEWTHWLMDHWGEELYWEHYQIARGVAHVDLEGVIAALSEEQKP